MSTANKISIIKVASRNDKSEFISLSANIYKNSPNRVPPLNSLVRHELDFNKNPFWKHAVGELFIAKINNKTVGRISAQIDYNFINFHNTKIGYFGFFECVNDFTVASALFSTAEKWLASRGMNKIQGPFSPSINADCGFMTKGFNEPHIFSTAYSLPYYVTLAEKYGFKKIKQLFAFQKIVADGVPEIFQKIAVRLKKNNSFTIKPINKYTLKNDVKIIVDIFNECWADNWGFSPITFDELYSTISSLKFFEKKTCALIAFHNNKPAGVCVTIPDINQLLTGSNGKLNLKTIYRILFTRNKITRCRNVILGVKKEFQNSGLPVLLFCESQPFVEKNFKLIEFSWILDDNVKVINFIKRTGAVLHKKYCVIEKNIC